jgi:hypothetical protein
MTMTPRLRRWIGRTIPLGLVLALVVHAPAGAAHDPPTVLERRVKAAYLYKFAGYVDWPPTAFHGGSDPLVIGVIGDDALARELERLVEGRRSSGRTVLVRRIEEPTEPGNAHLLFVGRSHADRTAEVVEALHLRPVLVVTESPRSMGHGAMINFVLEEGRVRFEVDLDAVERSGLGLSSRLLTVARTVTSKGS